MRRKRSSFSGRKNERRINALSRLAMKTNIPAAEIERANLKSRIRPQAQAEATRTKIDRSSRGKFQRHR